MRALVLVILIATCSWAQEKAPLSSQVFRELSELPEFRGFRDGGGQVISEPGRPSPRFAVSVWLSDSKTLFALLEIVTRDDAGKAYFRLLDTLALPASTPYRQYRMTDCDVAQKTWPCVLEVEFDDDGKPFPTPKKAWYPDLSSRRFEAFADTKRLRCTDEDEGGGCSGE